MIIPYSTIVRRRRTISISAPIACSVLDHDIIHLRRVNLSGRSLLSDKRPFLSQFHPGTFCKRVCSYVAVFYLMILLFSHLPPVSGVPSVVQQLRTHILQIFPGANAGRTQERRSSGQGDTDAIPS